ncbi:zinc finger CCCH-type antiviral protein 1-like isoform X2 [Ambystoma mexicanum]|uniref:zinc finger CCCH-type antiviral protein 1-like isoform X2 n=1 Tax=Ambystoma mexicanum TaxID=8296 RepID=UPI0037E720F7
MWEEKAEAEAQPGGEVFMSDPTISAFLTQKLCAHGGCLAVHDIPRHLSLPPAHIASILREEASRFLVAEQLGVVLAQSDVRLCINYLREQCKGRDCEGRDCGRLHLCRFFILGRCFHRSKGNSCGFSHDIQSEFNMAVLKAGGISNLDEKDLQILLLLNDPSFLPEVCKDYKGQRMEESCTKEERCDKLHICGFFARGQCRYSGCRRSHNLLDSNSIQLLQARGLGKEICQNIQLMRTHQCSEAQKEFRKNNSKGRSQSTTNINSSHTPQKPDVPLLEHPFRSLYPLGAPYTIFPNSGPSNWSLQTNKPNVHMPVGFQYPPSLLTLRLPPQLTKPQMPLGPSASLAVSSAEHREKSVPHLVTSPISGASHADKPARKMPVGTSSYTTASSGPQQSTSSISGAPQTNKPAAHTQVGLLPTPMLSCVPHLEASPLFCAPMTNKQVVQLPAGPPFTTGSKSKHPETLPYTRDQPQKKTTNTPVSASVSNISTLPPQGILSQTSSLIKPPMGKETTTAAKASQQHVSSIASTLKDLGDPNEICLHHIWKFCKKQNKCVQMHYYLPYRWQILEATGEWKDLSSMEEIEKAYCNPTNMSSTYHNIDFQKMTSSFSQVRRLSTASSVTKPSNYILTTNWVWYWKDEYGQWFEYGKQGRKEAAMITSTDLENIYLTDKRGALQFEARCQTYEINFKDMIQSNVVFGTEKEVLRRPKFVSQEDVGKLKASGNVSQGTTSPISPPDYWDRKALPRLGYEVATFPEMPTIVADHATPAANIYF